MRQLSSAACSHQYILLQPQAYSNGVSGPQTDTSEAMSQKPLSSFRSISQVHWSGSRQQTAVTVSLPRERVCRLKHSLPCPLPLQLFSLFSAGFHPAPRSPAQLHLAPTIPGWCLPYPHAAPTDLYPGLQSLPTAQAVGFAWLMIHGPFSVLMCTSDLIFSLPDPSPVSLPISSVYSFMHSCY